MSKNIYSILRYKKKNGFLSLPSQKSGVFDAFSKRFKYSISGLVHIC